MIRKNISARWLLLNRKNPIEMNEMNKLRLVALLAKMHSSEGFYAFDDPLEAAVFSVLVELMRELAKDENKLLFIE